MIWSTDTEIKPDYLLMKIRYEKIIIHTDPHESSKLCFVARYRKNDFR